MSAINNLMQIMTPNEIKILPGFSYPRVCVLRKSDVCNLEYENVIDSHITVDLVESKMKRKKKFPIVCDSASNFIPAQIIREYLGYQRQIKEMKRILLQIRKGKATRQRVGESSLAGVCKQVELYLGLKEPGRYTSHSMRRSAATSMAENLPLLKVKQDCQIRWNSSYLMLERIFSIRQSLDEAMKEFPDRNYLIMQPEE